MPEIKPPSRKDSTDSTRTIQPDRAGTPSLERSQRMAGESARLGKLDQRSRDLEGMRRVFPNALKDHQWEDYEQTLKALKTMDQNSEGYRKSEEILNLYDERIDTFKALKTKDPGSEGYRKSEETLNLYDRRIYMETAERDFPKALEDRQWSNYRQTLELFKTVDSSSRQYTQLEKILDHYDRRIEAERAIKKLEAETRKLEEETFDKLIASFPISRSNSSSNSNDEGGV